MHWATVRQVENHDHKVGIEVRRVASDSCYSDSGNKSRFDCMGLVIHYLSPVIPNEGLVRSESSDASKYRKGEEISEGGGWCCVTNGVSSICVSARFGNSLESSPECVILLKALRMKGYSISASTVCFQHSMQRQTSQSK